LKIDAKRHIAKTISYRILGTSITVITSLLFGASIEIAGLLGIGELLVKPLVYFFHERIWYKYIKFGLRKETN
jgi:uncharacterized membrane protein